MEICYREETAQTVHFVVNATRFNDVMAENLVFYNVGLICPVVRTLHDCGIFAPFAIKLKARNVAGSNGDVKFFLVNIY